MKSSSSKVTERDRWDVGDSDQVVLDVRALSKSFPGRAGGWRASSSTVHAVDNISFDIRVGETLALVGESGCGKSTTARMVARLVEPTSGHIAFLGQDITSLKPTSLKPIRRQMQMVFQDPTNSLNPQLTVANIIGEGLQIHRTIVRSKLRTRVQELAGLVGLGPEFLDRFPHQLSGGQRQRVGIARALAVQPGLLILDEPLSALDVSIQAQIINLLQDLKLRLGLSYLFISHDLSVVRHISDRVAVMYLGRIVESGTKHKVFEAPAHPYTRALLAAVPSVTASERSRPLNDITLEGDLPNPADPPSGCHFRTRCWKAQEVCATEVPPLIDQRNDAHLSACHFPYLEPMATSDRD